MMVLRLKKQEFSVPKLLELLLTEKRLHDISPRTISVFFRTFSCSGALPNLKNSYPSRVPGSSRGFGENAPEQIPLAVHVGGLPPPFQEHLEHKESRSEDRYPSGVHSDHVPSLFPAHGRVVFPQGDDIPQENTMTVKHLRSIGDNRDLPENHAQRGGCSTDAYRARNP